MSLTARGWLLLPKAEMENRKVELSSEECRKLRSELSMIHFTEEQKAQMTEKEKYDFVHQKEKTVEERDEFNKKVREIFKQLQNTK